MRASRLITAVIGLGIAVLLATHVMAQPKIYVHYSVKVKPGMRGAFEDLIINEGLPLFKGYSTMVGYWKTLMGDFNEMICIWLYDNVSKFEQRVNDSENNSAFQRFARERNTLVTDDYGEMLQLPEWANAPDLPIKGHIVIHETHIVKHGNMQPYLEYWRTTALAGLKEAGFRIVGPFIQHSGDSDEMLILICFESLAERDAMLAAFGNFAIAKTFPDMTNKYLEGFHIKILTPSKINR